ncbi:hypothetical protein TH25_22840 [Thalassospira profundimaris]|uniref:Response regulatory domain-containing protein n=1 Tax=Thalassospira profundimaris TaxID=502049 RepID=A0A367WLZ9_9PROT|nr:response regulator [Thalassospira profundimaris]RCK42454.1 hypothetical protein TH25_22840 [Thalassospira profundimaris]
MRLDFNVLWVDDQPDRIDAQIKAIKIAMLDEGFEFNPTKCQSVDRVKEKIADNVFCDEIDLVLVDWDLGGGVQGQEAIREIRERVPYKDVVFYSAMTEADELRKLVFDNNLEGVFCVRRSELVDEVSGVFESLVKKVLDLDHTRGIVMGATSDIDLLAGQCLIAMYRALDEQARMEFVKDALSRIAKKVERMRECADKLHVDAEFASILKEHMLFTAIDRLRMLSTALKSSEKGKAYRVAVTEYIEKVVPKRNSLGHQVLNPTSRELADVVEGSSPITVEEMRELRCALLSLRSQFRDLHAALID